jgi:hypothetical protein
MLQGGDIQHAIDTAQDKWNTYYMQSPEH